MSYGITKQFSLYPIPFSAYQLQRGDSLLLVPLQSSPFIRLYAMAYSKYFGTKNKKTNASTIYMDELVFEKA